MTNYITKGTTDDFTTCDCCGRVDLKCTVIMAVADAEGNATSEVKHFGRSCAAKHAGRSAAVIAKEARKADKETAHAAMVAKMRADREYDALWFAFLEANSDAPTTLDKIRDLGGHENARKLFVATH